MAWQDMLDQLTQEPAPDLIRGQQQQQPPAVPPPIAPEESDPLTGAPYEPTAGGMQPDPTPQAPPPPPAPVAAPSPPPPIAPVSTAQAPAPAQAQPSGLPETGGWRGMLENLTSGVGNMLATPAEARTPKKMTVEEFTQKQGHPPESDADWLKVYANERPGGREGTPLPEGQAPLQTPAQKKKPHVLGASEYETMLWGEKERKKQEARDQPHYLDAQGNINWDVVKDPKYGIFPFSYPSTYKELRQRSQKSVEEGYGKMTGEAAPTDTMLERAGQIGAGAFQAALPGALGYTLSPLEAGVKSIASQPISNISGIPEEYLRYAMELGIPGLGLPRTSAMRARPQAMSQYRLLQRDKLLNPTEDLSTPQGFRQHMEDLKVTPNVPGAAPKGIRSRMSQGFKEIEKRLSPETTGPAAADAVRAFREYGGVSAREAAVADKSFSKVYKQVEQAKDPVSPSPYKATVRDWTEKDTLSDYIDGGKSPRPQGEMGKVADLVRATLKKTTADLKKVLTPEEISHLRDEYMQHTWKNWDTAAPELKATATARGMKSTTGAGIKQRSELVKTYGEGRALGLQPAFSNPLDQAMSSITNMQRTITGRKVLEEGLDSGMVRKVTKGTSEEETLKDAGYAELTGKPGHYAPEGYARIWNNYYSDGVSGEWGKTYDVVRHLVNANTQALLGFSGYHALTMAEATMGTQIARAFNKLGQGKFSEGLGELGETPFAPLTYYGRGRYAEKAYLREIKADPESEKAIDYITRGGGKMGGKQALAATQDVAMSRLGSFADSLKKGTLGREYAWKDLTVGKTLGTFGRILDTVNEPLFKVVIPRLKNGANMKQFQDFLKDNPNATEGQRLAEAKRIVDSTDNRFGEMIQDNIFWNKALKQGAMLGLLSYSWNLGGYREWGGGVRDLARSAMTGQGISPKGQYVIASAMLWGLMNTVANKLHTDKYPWEMEHPMKALMGFYTGGKTMVFVPPDPTKGESKPHYEEVDEQGRVPGYMKDMIAYMTHPIEELSHKVNPGIGTLLEISGVSTDWKNDPVYDQRTAAKLGDQAPTWFGNAVSHLIDRFMPITAQNILGTGTRQNPATGLNRGEQLMGMQPAQAVIQNPYEARTRAYFGGKAQELKDKRAASRRTRFQELGKKYKRPPGVPEPEYGGPNP